MGWLKGKKRGGSSVTETMTVTPSKGNKMTPATTRLHTMLEALLKAKAHRNNGISVIQLAAEAEEQLVNLIIPDSEFELEQEKELLEYLTARIDERNEQCLSQREKITDEWNASRLTDDQDTNLEALDEMSQ